MIEKKLCINSMESLSLKGEAVGDNKKVLYVARAFASPFIRLFPSDVILRDLLHIEERRQNFLLSFH